jgi:hypothetical protein
MVVMGESITEPGKKVKRKRRAKGNPLVAEYGAGGYPP